MLNTSNITKVITLLFLSIQVMAAQAVSSEDMLTRDSIRYLKLPERLEKAMGGAAFVEQVAGMDQSDRERVIVREILLGNVPSFSRRLKPLHVREVVDGKSYELTFFASQDYLAIGSDEDYLYIPITPLTAQYLANQLDCFLPSPKMVDIIYNSASIKLIPQPIPPSDSMTSVPVFQQHTDSIAQQMMEKGIERASKQIIAGHKKDIIISNKIYTSNKPSGSVVIYGWHLGENDPIQPVYNGHHARYADYSHGTRLISKFAFLNGEAILIDQILKDEKLSILLSKEGVINKPNYPERE